MYRNYLAERLTFLLLIHALYLVSMVRFVSLYLASPFNSFVSQEYSMLFI